MGRAHAHGYTVAPHVRELGVTPRLRVISGRDEAAVAARRRALRRRGVDRRLARRRHAERRRHRRRLHAAGRARRGRRGGRRRRQGGPLREAARRRLRVGAAAPPARPPRRACRTRSASTTGGCPRSRCCEQLVRDGTVGEVLLWRGSFLSDEFLDPDIPFDWRFERRLGGSTVRRPRHAPRRPRALDGRRRSSRSPRSRRRSRAQRSGRARRRRRGVVCICCASGTARAARSRSRGSVRGGPATSWSRSTARRGTLRFDYARLNELWHGDVARRRHLLRHAPDPRRAPVASVRRRLVADRPGRRLRRHLRQPGGRPAGALA